MNRRERRKQKKILLASPNTEHTQAGNYYSTLLKMAQGAEPGKVYTTTIRHDKWCVSLDERGPCNCSPDIEMEEFKGKI